jgi:2-haloacid dehalogenase
VTLDYGRFEALTFDCYGTMIDWESGLTSALREALPQLDRVDDDPLLEAYARHEAAAEEPPYRTYRQVLVDSVRALAGEHGVAVSADAAMRFAESVNDWPAFADAPGALQRLGRLYRLGVITNCDDDLFAASSDRLGADFEWVVTAQQVRSYKPSRRNFEHALAVIDVPRDRILHVAQSLYHDHVPAKELGLTTVWIDRRQGRAGAGATPTADARPDATFPTLQAFAESAVPAFG